MKALIIDHDAVAAQFLVHRLQALGLEVFHEADKHAAVDVIVRQRLDLVFLDPSPLASGRPVVLNIRRTSPHYPYICLMARDIDPANALASGTNDALSKPVDPEALKTKVSNAQRLLAMIRTLGDDSQDYPSTGGVIAKSAFNQLFLAALDRADRYAERTYMLFFAMESAGQSADLARALVQLRRQSDIIGQIGPASYALLLQRPAFASEPLDAAARFAEALGVHNTAMKTAVSLIEIPTGAVLASYHV